MGGVPDIEILQAELYSDRLAKMAYENIIMEPFRKHYGDEKEGLKNFIDAGKKRLVLEPEVTDLKTAQSLVMLLHFNSEDPDHCVAAVKSYGDALEEYYKDKHKSSRGELVNFIKYAINELNPQVESLDKDYREFRNKVKLVWDSEGRVINPHREQQLYLMERKNKLLEDLRDKEAILASLREISQKTEDPRVVLSVMSQILGVRITLPESKRPIEDVISGDEILSGIDLDKKLLPLMLERNKNAREYGANHPSVKTLDSQIETMKAELGRLLRDESNRIAKLMKDKADGLTDPIKQAKETVEALILQANAEVNLAKQNVSNVDSQIEQEGRLALTLSNDEHTSELMLRNLNQHLGLMRE